MPAPAINQYTVVVEGEELRAAEAHIAHLEEELLRLKDVKRELQALRAQHQELRRSAQGRIANLLSAPFRLFRRGKSASPALTEYERWLAKHRVSPDELAQLRERSRAFAYQPLVSILTPTFNPNEDYLSAAIDSVLAQVYENWELIVVDDGSERPSSAPQRFAERDARVRVFLEKRHSGISAALNSALAHARGQWIALLDHDDLLEPDALFCILELLQKDRGADVIYCDEDKIIDGRLAAPMLKPAWSPELFLTHDYLGHFVIIRRELVDKFRSEFDGAQDYDLLLRVSEKTDRIRHVPRVLYHWRRTAESTAHNIRRKPGALEAGRHAIAQHLERGGERGRVTIDWQTHVYRVRLQREPVAISIVLRHNEAKAAATIRERTNYPHFDIITELGALLDLESELVLFLDDDLEPLKDDWLWVLAEWAQQSEIGAVGPRILNSDGTVESAGLILLPGGNVASAFAGMRRNFAGANRQMQTVRNYSALSASCLMTRRSVLEKISGSGGGGFIDSSRDLVSGPSNKICAEVEFCLKLRAAGLRPVSVPYAELQRISPRRPSIHSCPELAKNWPEAFEHDAFRNREFAEL